MALVLVPFRRDRGSSGGVFSKRDSIAPVGVAGIAPIDRPTDMESADRE